MRKMIIALVATLSFSLAVATPAGAQFWGYGGYGWGMGYGAGFGYSAAIAGVGLAAGAIAGAAIANSYPYGPYYGNSGGWGYAPGGYPAAYTYRPAPVRKNIIIKNSPGARVYEEDDIFGW